jgi:hypothetical protein
MRLLVAFCGCDPHITQARITSHSSIILRLLFKYQTIIFNFIPDIGRKWILLSEGDGEELKDGITRSGGSRS